MGSYRSSSLKCAVGSKKSWTESWHRAPTRSAVRPSAGLFERRDKYSPPVPDRYFSSLSQRDFHGSQLNAHASANSDSIHGRLCRTVQSFGFISQRANSASTGSMGVLVSDSSTGSCLSSLVLFACFMAWATAPPRTRFPLCAKCSAVRHVKNPICLFNWVEWGKSTARAEEHDDNVTVFVISKAKKKKPFMLGFWTVCLRLSYYRNHSRLCMLKCKRNPLRSHCKAPLNN